MLILNGIIFLVYFLVISVIDLRKRAVPSILMTAGIFVALLLNPNSLVFGVSAFILAWAVRDLDDSFGVADLKAFAIMGLLVVSVQGLLFLFISFAILQFGYTILVRRILKVKGEFPFLPVFFMMYVVMWISGGFVV